MFENWKLWHLLKIENQKLKIRKTSCGFTLVEILVGIALIGMVGGIAVSIFTSLTNAYNKSLIINELQQEGGRVMEEIARVVRGGKSLSGTMTELIVVNDDLGLEYLTNGNCKRTLFSLSPAVPRSSNGRLIKSYQDKDGNSCSGVGVGAITDSDPLSGISVTAASFQVISGGGVRPDKVEVSLTIEQGEHAPARQDFQAKADLRSTITTRSYWQRSSELLLYRGSVKWELK